MSDTKREAIANAYLRETRPGYANKYRAAVDDRTVLRELISVLARLLEEGER